MPLVHQLGVWFSNPLLEKLYSDFRAFHIRLLIKQYTGHPRKYITCTNISFRYFMESFLIYSGFYLTSSIFYGLHFKLLHKLL